MYICLLHKAFINSDWKNSNVLWKDKVEIMQQIISTNKICNFIILNFTTSTTLNENYQFKYKINSKLCLQVFRWGKLKLNESSWGIKPLTNIFFRKLVSRVMQIFLMISFGVWISPGQIVIRHGICWRSFENLTFIVECWFEIL